MRKCRECPNMIEHIGICQVCADRMRLREHWVAMDPALKSIPEKYRWALWGSELIYQRVPDFKDIAVQPAELLTYPILLFHGESGAGKTSLASALGRSLVDSASPDSDPAILRRARGFRFVSADEVPTPRTPLLEGPAAAFVARAATVLLLDDVGQEAGAGGAYQAHERCREVKDLMEYCYKRERQIIATTYDGPEEWAARYGAGIARRYWESGDSKVIELRRAS